MELLAQIRTRGLVLLDDLLKDRIFHRRGKGRSRMIGRRLLGASAADEALEIRADRHVRGLQISHGDFQNIGELIHLFPGKGSTSVLDVGNELDGTIARIRDVSETEASSQTMSANEIP